MRFSSNGISCPQDTVQRSATFGRRRSRVVVVVAVMTVAVHVVFLMRSGGVKAWRGRWVVGFATRFSFLAAIDLVRAAGVGMVAVVGCTGRRQRPLLLLLLSVADDVSVAWSRLTMVVWIGSSRSVCYFWKGHMAITAIVVLTGSATAAVVAATTATTIIRP